MFRNLKLLPVLLLFCGLTAHTSEKNQRIRQEIDRIELSAEIGRLVAEDQSYRFGMQLAAQHGIRAEELTAAPLFRKKIGDVDARTLKKIKPIVAKLGWPKLSEYGQYMTNNLWLLVQHMDADVPFQETVLAKMETLLSSGEVDKTNYAYLYDRVQTGKGALQRYGTQGQCDGKEWKPKAMEKPEEVDKRRAEMGMSSMAEYFKLVKGSCL